MPGVHEAVLDDEAFERYLDDLRTCAQDLTVLTKAGASRLAEPVRDDPLQVIAAFRRQEVPAVQIRYVFEQENWCDTLMRCPEGARLIRTKQ